MGISFYKEEDLPELDDSDDDAATKKPIQPEKQFKCRYLVTLAQKDGNTKTAGTIVATTVRIAYGLVAFDTDDKSEHDKVRLPKRRDVRILRLLEDWLLTFKVSAEEVTPHKMDLLHTHESVGCATGKHEIVRLCGEVGERAQAGHQAPA